MITIVEVLISSFSYFLGYQIQFNNPLDQSIWKGLLPNCLIWLKLQKSFKNICTKTIICLFNPLLERCGVCSREKLFSNFVSYKVYIIFFEIVLSSCYFLGIRKPTTCKEKKVKSK